MIIIRDVPRPLSLPSFVAIAFVAIGLLFHIYVIALPTETLTARYLADDYFYYLAVAHNIAAGHGSSFDGGITATNGYQPLFLAFLVIVFAAGASKLAAIHIGLAIQALALAAAAWPAYRLLASRGAPWGGTLVAGLLSTNLFFALPTLTGFEMALALALGLWTLWWWQQSRSALAIGILCGLAVLARVDLLVVPGVIGLALLIKRRFREAFALAALCALVLSPWIIWSTARFGGPFPDSGFVKAHFRGLSAIGAGLQTAFDALPRVIVPGVYVDRLADDARALLWCMAAILIVAATWQIRHRRNWPLAAIGGLIGAAYVTLIDPAESGALVRYLFPVWVIVLLLVAQNRPAQFAWVVVPILLIHLWDLASYTTWERRAPSAATYVGLAHTVMPRVIAGLDPSLRIASFDSGALGYFADRPVINLDGLANHEIVELQRHCPSAYRECLVDYFHKRQIHALIGGTAFGWTTVFPEWQQWQRLYESPPLSDGSSIVILRIP